MCFLRKSYFKNKDDIYANHEVVYWKDESTCLSVWFPSGFLSNHLPKVSLKKFTPANLCIFNIGGLEVFLMCELDEISLNFCLVL